MFFFKEKPIVFDCFTTNEQAYKWAPIKESRYFIPTWWKDLDGEVPAIPHKSAEVSTMKRCEGFISLYRKGFMLPLWSDLSITVGSLKDPKLSYIFASQEKSIQDHPAWQRGRYLPEPNYAHGKIISPWAVRSNKLVACSVFQPTWNFEAPEMIIVPPATVEYKYQASTHVNFFLPVIQVKRQFTIPFNTPLMQIVPQTDKKFELKLHLVDEKEYRLVQLPVAKFTRNYRTLRSIQEQNNG